MKIFGQQRDGCVPANKIGTSEDVHRWIMQSQRSPRRSERSDGSRASIDHDDTCCNDKNDDGGSRTTESLLDRLANNDGIIAQLEWAHIETGKLLGTGSFCNVLQITELHEDSHVTTNGSDHPSKNKTLQLMNNNAAAAQSWLQGTLLKLQHAASAKTSKSKNNETTTLVENDNHDEPGGGSSSSPAAEGQLLALDKEETTTLDPLPAVRCYAVKVLDKELLKNKRVFKAAAEDLMTEAMYLIRCRGHPNILQIRGVPAAGVHAWKENSFFIMTDRLDGTLDERMEEWKRHYLSRCDTPTASSEMVPVVVSTPADLRLKTRYAWQICNALSFLHKQKVIYRDLKPENVGLIADRKQQARKSDQQSHPHGEEEDDERIQLFDLGLCRDLNSFPKWCEKRRRTAKKTSVAQINDDVGVVHLCPHDEHDKDDKQDYHDDGYTAMYNIPVISGSLRYMAGEIFLTEGKCNLKSDIYSWALVFYEMLSLEVVFEGYSRKELKEMVWKGGCRPSLSKSEGLSNLISPITILLKKSWSKYPARRPTSKQCCEALEHILAQLEKL